MEDETGIANIIVSPDVYEQQRDEVTRYPFIVVEGILQNQQGAISVKLTRAEPLNFEVAEMETPPTVYVNSQSVRTIRGRH